MPGARSQRSESARTHSSSVGKRSKKNKARITRRKLAEQKRAHLAALRSDPEELARTEALRTRRTRRMSDPPASTLAIERRLLPARASNSPKSLLRKGLQRKK